MRVCPNLAILASSLESFSANQVWWELCSYSQRLRLQRSCNLPCFLLHCPLAHLRCVSALEISLMLPQGCPVKRHYGQGARAPASAAGGVAIAERRTEQSYAFIACKTRKCRIIQQSIPPCQRPCASLRSFITFNIWRNSSPPRTQTD